VSLSGIIYPLSTIHLILFDIDRGCPRTVVAAASTLLIVWFSAEPSDFDLLRELRSSIAAQMSRTELTILPEQRVKRCFLSSSVGCPTTPVAAAATAPSSTSAPPAAPHAGADAGVLYTHACLHVPPCELDAHARYSPALEILEEASAHSQALVGSATRARAPFGTVMQVAGPPRVDLPSPAVLPPDGMPLLDDPVVDGSDASSMCFPQLIISCLIAGDDSIFVSTRSQICRIFDGVVNVLVGEEAGFQDGGSDVARFDHPVIASHFDAHGRLVVADTNNNRIRVVQVRDGSTRTLAGTGEDVNTDGACASASFDTPSDVVVGPTGALFVVVRSEHASPETSIQIRKIANGMVETIDLKHSIPRASSLTAIAQHCFLLQNEKFVFITNELSYTDSTSLARHHFDAVIPALQEYDPRAGVLSDPQRHPTEFMLEIRFMTGSPSGALYCATDTGVYELPPHAVDKAFDGGGILLAAINGASCLYLDDESGVLVVCSGSIEEPSRVETIQVHTRRERRAMKMFPFVRLWALAQDGRLRIGSTGSSVTETRSRDALWHVLQCPITDVVSLVLAYVIA
jgi:hypothetical protein